MKPLTSTVRKQLAAMPNIVSVFPELRFTADLRYGGTGHVTSASSVPFERAAQVSSIILPDHFSPEQTPPKQFCIRISAQQLADQGKISTGNDLIGQEITHALSGT